MIDTATNSLLSQIQLYVIPDSERQRVQADLAKIEAQLKKEAKLSVETLALYRAQYFAQQGLWSDALQEALSVKQPSRDLTQFIQMIKTLSIKNCETKRASP